MRLPKRGFLTNPDGRVVWAWEHNDPNTHFDALPPFIGTMDGEEIFLSVAQPDSVVIDLDEEGLEPGDIHLLHDTLDKTRVHRRPNGSLRLVQIIPDDVPVEIDHPLVDVINMRRAKKGKPPLKKGR